MDYEVDFEKVLLVDFDNLIYDNLMSISNDQFKNDYLDTMRMARRIYQIYSALEQDGVTSIIGIHACGERSCPVEQNIRKVLETPYHKIEDAVRNAMEEITLQSMIDDLHGIVQQS